MIEAIRITVGNHMPYHGVKILEEGELDLPNFFEDGMIAFTCKDGTFMVPDYGVDLIHIRRTPIRPPAGAKTYKRITIDGEQTAENIYVIEQDDYDRYGIPVVFPHLTQFVYSCREGVFITSDYSILFLQVC